MWLIAFAIGAFVIFKANEAMEEDHDQNAWFWLLLGCALLMISHSLLT